MQRAKMLATRLGAYDQERIGQAYARLLQRPPTPREVDLGRAYLKSGGTLESYTQVLLTGNEFLYLD